MANIEFSVVAELPPAPVRMHTAWVERLAFARNNAGQWCAVSEHATRGTANTTMYNARKKYGDSGYEFEHRKVGDKYRLFVRYTPPTGDKA